MHHFLSSSLGLGVVCRVSSFALRTKYVWSLLLSTFRLWVLGATILGALPWHGRYHGLGRKRDLRGS